MRRRVGCEERRRSENARLVSSAGSRTAIRAVPRRDSRSREAPLRWQQSSSEQIQVREREGREQPRGVLRQAAVAHLGEAPQALDHMEGVLARARPRDRNRLMRADARSADALGPAAVDSVADAARFSALPMRFAPVRLIPEHLPSCTMQQLGHWVMSSTFAAVVSSGCARCRAGRCRRAPSSRSATPCPSCVWCISGSRRLSAFFVEVGAAMIVASTIVPDFSSSRFSSSSDAHLGKDPPRSAGASPAGGESAGSSTHPGTSSSASSMPAKRRIDSMS